MNKFINPISDNVLTKRDKKRNDGTRSPYFRDMTAIMHSSPFRRLKHKAQVFISPSNDHICTRIEHVLHVASISASIASSLGLNTELCWAIGLGHDLGHTPFGHSGERIINEIWTDYNKRNNLPKSNFQHEINSLRVVDKIANSFEGLNLTYAVRDGIVSHCGEDFSFSKYFPDNKIKDFSKITTRESLIPSTWEGLITRVSDLISYLGRDREDAIRMGIIKAGQMPESAKKLLGEKNGEIINTLVEDIINNSSMEKGIRFSDKVAKEAQNLANFNLNYIYRCEKLKSYEYSLKKLLNLLFNYLEEIYDKYGVDFDSYSKERNPLSQGFGNFIKSGYKKYVQRNEGKREMLFDYLCGMTDSFSRDCAKELLFPDYLAEDATIHLMSKWFDSPLE